MKYAVIIEVCEPDQPSGKRETFMVEAQHPRWAQVKAVDEARAKYPESDILLVSTRYLTTGGPDFEARNRH